MPETPLQTPSSDEAGAAERAEPAEAAAQAAPTGHPGSAAKKTEPRRAKGGRGRFESLVQAIDGIVWEVDAETLPPIIFTFVSKQAERILGYPVEQWLSEPDFWENHM